MVGMVGTAGRVIRLDLIPLACYLIGGGILTILAVCVVFPTVFHPRSETN